MRPIRKTITATGETDPIPLDIYIAPFQVAVNVQLTAGTCDYTLQYTYDPILDVGASGFQWIDDTTMDNETASSSVNLVAPVTAIRLSVAALSGGNLKLTVVQAGNGL